MPFQRPPLSALEAALQRRRYVHFDRPLSSVACTRLVSTPEAVAKHSFFPFLRHDIVRARIKRLSSGRLQKKNKVRIIRYASHADAAIYSYYNFNLAILYEAQLAKFELQQEVIAFRALAKSNVDFAQEAFEWIGQNQPCVALGFDVKDFFGSLNHALLKSSWAQVLGLPKLPADHYAVFCSLTKFSSVELIAARKVLGISRRKSEGSDRLCSIADFKGKVKAAGLIETNAAAKGIPQGSPMSALLSNVYMIVFDRAMKKLASGVGGYYRRYCDDILLVVPELAVEDVKKEVAASLAELKLEMQESKTLECRFAPIADKPLQYLGLVYDGKSTFLRPSGVAKFYNKMRAGVMVYRNAKVRDGKTHLLIQRRKELIQRYTEHVGFGKRNYFSYVKPAAVRAKSAEIRRQLRFHAKRFGKLAAI